MHRDNWIRHLRAQGTGLTD